MARTRKTAEQLPQPDPHAPLDVAGFLAAATRVLDLLTDDLLARADESPAVTLALRRRHEDERKKQQTADTFAVWQCGVVVQIAASWLLSCVFVRTLEDRGMLARHRLAGPGARDAQHAFLQLAPHLGMREYLLLLFTELGHYPAAKPLFHHDHDLAWRLMPSQDGAKALVELFRAPDPEQPHFRFGQPSTRFLGDLYQDLSEDVRKRYALLQTPDFVEAFILDRTLEPAIEQFGLAQTRVIDPTCGSGHFLLGAFERLHRHFVEAMPDAPPTAHVEQALAGVVGVDVNPYAVSIARFRLTLAAIAKLGHERIKDAPELGISVVVADSLLHNYDREQAGFGDLFGTSAEAWYGQEFAVQDEAGAKQVLRRGYAAVVGNPPYITVKDAALRDKYREIYSAAYREYSLSVPFMQRFFELACEGGFVGQITANSFMKREFGKKVIEEFLPTVDLESIVNTSGAYIPGHGTPTVILFGRSRKPVEAKLTAVLARRGEPTTPEDPAQGRVWTSIVEHGEEIGYEDEYITVAKIERERLAVHPWSLEGGGVASIVEHIENSTTIRLADKINPPIGRAARIGADDVYMLPPHVAVRMGVGAECTRPIVIGECIRDWAAVPEELCAFPYEQDYPNVPRAPETLPSPLLRHMWPYRATLQGRATFQGTMQSSGRPWTEYMQYTTSGNMPPLSIAFAFVATHNHFVLDRGGKVFKQTAPIIKLPESASEDEHLALLAYLNSSTACFWMKQVCFDKGATIEKNAEQAKTAYEFSGTLLSKMPIPNSASHDAAAGRLAAELSQLATARARLVEDCLPFTAETLDAATLRARLSRAERDDADTLARMVFLQDEIDWLVYEIFGLAPPTTNAALSLDRPDERLALGCRPSEVRAARRGERVGIDGQVLHAVVPDDVPVRVRELVETRIARMAADPRLDMLERPEYKRRWWIPRVELGAGRGDTFASRVARHCDAWLRDRVERLAKHLGGVVSRSELVRHAYVDGCMSAVADHLQLSIEACVGQALESEAVPFVAAMRFTESGLTKHAAWRHTWDLQRREDAGESVGEIPVPPKYDQKDFRDAVHWRMRGKLDVPKERFIAYPGLESDDGEPLYGWAGWDHAQRAAALLTLYNQRRSDEHGAADRLAPILVGVHELLPWIEQWHDQPDPDTGELLGPAYRDWLAEELRVLGLTPDDLDAWRPAKKSGKKASKKAAAKPPREPETREPETGEAETLEPETGGPKRAKKKASKKSAKKAT